MLVKPAELITDYTPTTAPRFVGLRKTGTCVNLIPHFPQQYSFKTNLEWWDARPQTMEEQTHSCFRREDEVMAWVIFLLS